MQVQDVNFSERPLHDQIPKALKKLEIESFLENIDLNKFKRFPKIQRNVTSFGPP